MFDLAALAQGIPDEAYKPLTGDDKETAKHFAKRNKAERGGQGALDFARGSGRLPADAPIAGAAKALRAMTEDTPEEIAAKRKRFEAALADPRRWSLRIAADLYVAAFLAPKIGGVPVNRNTVTIPTTAHIWDALAGKEVYGPLVTRAHDLAGEARAFHWPLVFPDVMTAGGFDVVLGNSPWERIKLQEQEFFAARDPEIAQALNAAARGRLIAKLKAAWDNGYRLERGIEGGWLRYGSTTAPGDIWIAGAAPHGPWLLSIDHAGVAAETGALPVSPIAGPGLVTFLFATLSQLHAALVAPRYLSRGHVRR